MDEDPAYESDWAREADLAYQGLFKGVIAPGAGFDMWKEGSASAKDDYRFLRRHFSPVWAKFSLMMRILGFHNPASEFTAFWQTRNVRQINPYEKVADHSQYDSFESELVKEQPLVTVVIPTLNRYEYLRDVLADLERQTYQHFEVIVVDQSEPFQGEFYDGWELDLQVLHQEEKALWLARNRAIQAAKGDYLLLYDDDSRVEPDWIHHHLKCLDYFQAEISSGVSFSTVGGNVPQHYRFFRWSDQLDTGNVLIKREVFEQIGLFDRQFEKQRMGDGEFGLRAYRAGFKSISNPHASRIHLKVGSGGLRQMGSWDAYRPKSYNEPRPIPSVLYLFRKYYGDRAALYNVIKNVPPSVIPYKYKRSKPLRLLGYTLTVLFLPLVFYQVIRSWKMASDKLKAGPKIGTLAPKQVKSY